MRCYNIQQQSSVLVLIPRVSLRFVLSLAEIGDHVILLALPVSQIYKFFTAALFTETEFFIRIPFTWISVFCFFCSYVPRHFQYGTYVLWCSLLLIPYRGTVCVDIDDIFS